MGSRPILLNRGWSETQFLKMLLAPLVVVLSLATSIHSLSAPECADGSISVCKCGDGNPPDFSTFPPCDIKKGKPKCECSGGGALLQSTSNQGQRDLAVLAGLPALTKPLLSVSNAPEEAAPPQRQGAIRNVPPAPSSVRMALHSCVS